MSKPPVLELREVTRIFHQAGERLSVLRGVNLKIAEGELVALVGPSGAGKSTLLHLAGLLERPTTGKVIHGSRDVATLTDRARTEIRRAEVGFVYQHHHLLPEFSALENVMMPRIIAGAGKEDAGKRATELLLRVGLGERLTHRPGRLSGGEQQRVAVARALANKPNLLLADEPTGNLDHGHANAVFDLLLELAREEGLSALVATHNLDLAGRMDRALEIHEGKLRDHAPRFENAPAPEPAAKLRNPDGDSVPLD